MSKFSCIYCAFHKHANSKVQKWPSQLRFLLPSIVITITSNEPWNTETQKTDRNPPIRNHNPWPFEPVKVKFCFLRGLLSWLTAAKNAIVSWLLNFRIRMFVKSAVNLFLQVSTWKGLIQSSQTCLIWVGCWIKFKWSTWEFQLWSDYFPNIELFMC